MNAGALTIGILEIQSNTTLEFRRLSEKYGAKLQSTETALSRHSAVGIAATGGESSHDKCRAHDKLA